MGSVFGPLPISHEREYRRDRQLHLVDALAEVDGAMAIELNHVGVGVDPLRCALELRRDRTQLRLHRVEHLRGHVNLVCPVAGDGNVPRERRLGQNLVGDAIQFVSDAEEFSR